MASKSIYLSLTHTLTLTVSNTIDNANNRSWIAWTLTVSGNSTYYDTYVKATVNGSVVYNKTVGWNGGFPAQTGSTSGGFYVSHNSDGSKSISMALEGYVYSYSTSYTSGTLVCTATDRSAPAVTTRVTGITHNSCTLNISASGIASSNGYAYQIKTGSGAYGSWIYNNNGSWTITGLTPNTTYTINGAAKKSSNNVWGYNATSFITLGQATLSSASDTTLGDNATFKWTPLVAEYQYRLQIKIGGTVVATFPDTSTYITGPFTAGTEYIYTHSLSLDLANYITTSMSTTATAVLTTYNGSTQIGEVSSKDFIITVPENSSTQPVLSVNNIILGEGTQSGFGVLTTGYSTLQATIPTSAIELKYGTIVNSITMTVNNKTFTGALSSSNYIVTTTTIVTPGTHTVTFVVQDARGLTATGTKEITFYEYFAPNGMISSEVNNTSNGFITNFSWNVASVNGNNTATVLVERIKNLTTVASDTTTVNSDNYSSSKTWTQINISDATTATYNYRLTITDVKHQGNEAIIYEITTSQICISRLGGGKGVTLFKDAQYEGFWIRDIQHDISTAQYYTLASLIASNYSVTASYDIGDFTNYGDVIYECSTPIVGGEAWDATHWTQIPTS